MFFKLMTVIAAVSSHTFQIAVTLAPMEHPKLSLSSHVSFGEWTTITCEKIKYSKFIDTISIEIPSAEETFTWRTEYDSANIIYRDQRRILDLHRLPSHRRRAFTFKSGNFSLVANRSPTYFLRLKLPVDGRINGSITCRVDAIEGTASVTEKVTVEDEEKHACPRSPHISMTEPIRPKPETKVQEKKQTVPQRTVNVIYIRNKPITKSGQHSSSQRKAAVEKRSGYSLGQDLHDLGKCFKKFLRRQWFSVLIFISAIVFCILFLCIIKKMLVRRLMKTRKGNVVFCVNDSEKLMKAKGFEA